MLAGDVFYWLLSINPWKLARRALTALFRWRLIDFIHDTRYLCTRSRIDGIKAMSRGISGGKQVIKSRPSLFILSKRGDDFTVMQNVYRVLARFTSLLFAMRTSTVATAHTKLTMINSTHVLTLSSLRWKSLHFLLSRTNKLDRDFFHCNCFHLFIPWQSTWHFIPLVI